MHHLKPLAECFFCGRSMYSLTECDTCGLTCCEHCLVSRLCPDCRDAEGLDESGCFEDEEEAEVWFDNTYMRGGE